MKKHLKPIAYSLIMMSTNVPLSLYAMTDVAPVSPFYDKPFYLAGGFKSQAKPNIMLYIDNSGSMESNVDVLDKNGSYITRMQAVKNALNALLDPSNPKVEENNWGVSYMNHSFHDKYNLATDVQTDKYSIEHVRKLKDSINNAQAYGASPGGEGYSRIVKNMLHNIKYRCDVNAIIFLSDGNINDHSLKIKIPTHIYQHNPKWGFIDGSEYNSQTQTFSGDYDGFWKNLNTPNAPRLNNKGLQNIVGEPDFNRPPISYLDWIVPNGGFKFNYSNDYNYRYGNLSYKGWTYPHPPEESLWPGFPYNAGNPIGNMVGPYGLAYMSYALSHNDLIKEDGTGAINKGRTDIENGNWDEKPYDKQTIETYTIAFGKGIENIPLANQYLDYGSRFGNKHKQGYFVAKNANDLLNVINKIANMNVSKNAYSIGTPSVNLLDNDSNDGANKIQAITSTINTENWSGELHFLRTNKKGEFIKNNKDEYIFDLPYYGSANIKASNNSRMTLVNKGGQIFNLSTDYHTILAKDGDNTSDMGTPKANIRTGLAMWLLRQTNKTDKEINKEYPQSKVRNRCNSNNLECKADAPSRQMGDIGNMPIYSIDDNTASNPKDTKRPSFVVTAANDGMVHILKDTNIATPTGNSVSYNPYELKLNYIPGSIPRENNKDTVLDRVRNTANDDYGNNGWTHQSLINGGMSWIRTRAKICTSNTEKTSTSETGECKRDKIAQVFISTTLGQGGKGAFNLNLGGYSFKDLINNSDNPSKTGLSNENMSTWEKSVPLWESGSDYPSITASKDNALDNTKDDNKTKIGLGYVLGAPALGVTILKRKKNKDGLLKPDPTSKRYYTSFISNGYFSADQTPSLYLYNAMNFSTTENINGSLSYNDSNGESILIKKISVALKDIGIPMDKNGLSTPTAIDYDLDGVMDLVYAGDYNGNLYRFDLRSENSDEWKVSKIYEGNKTQPITVAPSVTSLNPKLGSSSKLIIMFGTGSDIYDDDLDGVNSKNLQSFYGIFDDPSKEIGTSDKEQKLITFNNRESQLLQQSFTSSDVSDDNKHDTRYVSNHPITNEHSGWFIDLIHNNVKNGERVVTKANFTSKSVFFTSREYNAKLQNEKVCSSVVSSSSGYSYGLNIKTGGSLTNKTDRLGNLTKQINGLYASGYRMNGALSSPTILSPRRSNSMMYGVEGRNGDELSDLEARNFSVNCVPGSVMYITSSDGGITKGTPIICARNTYKRISWREIF